MSCCDPDRTDSALTLIDLDQPQPGYRLFISCWLYTAGGSTFLVDPGPASTISHLVAELRRLGVTRLDWVLLTHIHLDHGGGTGQLLDAYPEAAVVCFPGAAKHLVDPERLWEGSVAVLGDSAARFGQPAPVPGESIKDPDELRSLGFETILTPGHASHHQCYLHDDLLFVGEAAGMTCPSPDGLYMRPATPPRFHLDVALASLDRLLACERRPTRLAFGHYGLQRDAAGLLDRSRLQLVHWVRELATLSRTGDRSWSPQLQQDAVQRLQQTDSLFAPFSKLEHDLQSRELEYIRNTLEGILGWLALQDDD